MLSRRQFVSMSVIMLVILVMFQFTSVMKEVWNEYDTNTYAKTVTSALDGTQSFRSMRSETTVSDSFAIFIGDIGGTEVGQMVKLWCQYKKCDLLAYKTMAEVPANVKEKADWYLVDGEHLSLDTDVAPLIQLAKKGVSIVFCTLPDTTEIQQRELLRELLGIYRIYDSNMTVEGIELYDGFLFGGRTIYKVEEDADEKEQQKQDLELTMPWFGVYANAKRYMVGLLPEDTWGSENPIKNEDFPVIIWRTTIGKGHVFAVNGDYMKDVQAIGILDAMWYEKEPYALYPVVNAQNFVVANFAGLSSETDETMYAMYSRSQKAVFRDLIWSSLSSICTNSGDQPTFFLNPKLDYGTEEQPDEQQLTLLLKLFSEAQGENGLLLDQSSGNTVAHKLEWDCGFYRNTVPDYEFTSMYVNRENEEHCREILGGRSVWAVRTLSMEYNRLKAPVAYGIGGRTIQRETADGFEHTFSDDLRLKSLQTGLAYSSILVDLERVLYPNTVEDAWENSSERLASNVNTYWKKFRMFEKTTLTEGDGRVRRFLSLAYTEERQENQITVELEHFEEEAFFVLRTHNEELVEVEGGSFVEIEDYGYLIRGEEETLTLTLKSDTSMFYTYEP